MNDNLSQMTEMGCYDTIKIYKNIYPYNQVTGCVFVCVSVQKDLDNR